jgi:predicted O-methyltransferase YrrM
MWNKDTLDSYHDDPAITKLISEIEQKKVEFESSVQGATYRGDNYGFGGMKPEVSSQLYRLVREIKPRVLVETGVCNGVSTSVILAALEENGDGELYSIDLPEYTDTLYAQGAFWDGKKGAVVPRGRLPGWLIPDKYRQSWHLTLGRSQDKLVALLNGLQKIDFFMHDSEHSYECMSFEYNTAWKYIVPGGVLLSDDITWNTAFEDFSRQKGRDLHIINQNMAFIVK